MPKPWYSIKAAVEGSDVAEISILDAISSWYGTNAQSFLAEFRAIKANKVKLYINSPGGEVIEALAIFNGMRASGKEIEVHILGIAASAASYIAMAGDKIVMPRNTLMFLHNPISHAYGNAEDLRDVADTLDKLGTVLTDTYARRWKGDEKALAELMAAESLLTAEECLAHGFCDEVTDEIAATASFDTDTLPPAARLVFESAAAAAAAAAVEPQPAAVESQPATATLAEQIAVAVAAAGLKDYVAVFVTDPEATSLAAATALIERARDTVALATLAGLPDEAGALIRARKSMPEVRAALAKALHEADIRTRVDTSRRTGAGAESSAEKITPSSLWAAAHATKGKK